MQPCDDNCAWLWGEKPSQVRRSWTVNRSKPALCVVMRVGTMGGKKIQGRKRHLLVDTLGLLILVKVLAANITDREGGKVLLTPLVGKLPRLRLMWADSAYQGTFEDWVKEHLAGVRVEIVNHPWTGIKGTYAPIGTKVDWDKIIPRGFHLLPRRWLIERTNAWITHSRRLSRDFEGTHTSSEAFIYLAMSKLMVSRLAHKHP
jgi:putative transposase